MACFLVFRPCKKGYLEVCHERYNRIQKDGQAGKRLP